MSKKTELKYTLKGTPESLLEIEGELESLVHNGECLLQKVDSMSEVLDSCQRNYRLIRVQSKLWVVLFSLMALAAITATCLASWAVNRLRHLPATSEELAALIEPHWIGPVEFEVGQMVENNRGKKFMIRNIYQANDDEGRKRWVTKLQPMVETDGVTAVVPRKDVDAQDSWKYLPPHNLRGILKEDGSIIRLELK